MSKIIFNEHQIRQLELNPNVASLSDRSIQYTGDFKVRAVLENQEGKGPSQIFEEDGFDLTVIGRLKAKSALERWRKTYLPTRKGQNVYLSCVKDVATREIVAHHLSTSFHMDLVFQTTRKLEEHLDGNLHPEAMIHSDQGFHYTHPAYQSWIRGLGLVQSMSRRGNCLDNAPIESFFRHLKDHVEHRSALDLSDVRSKVDSYIDYYNSERKQWNLKKMTPEQYRSHLIAA